MAGPVLTLSELRPGGLPEAARLVAAGMCDNPTHLQAFGTLARERRCASLERFFTTVLGNLLRRGVVVGAFEDGVLSGVCGMAPPGECQPGIREMLALLPAVAGGTALGT